MSRFTAEVERDAAHARALGIYEAAHIRVEAVKIQMPLPHRIRAGNDQSIVLPSVEQQQGYIILLRQAIAALEESAAAAGVYQEADAAFRLGAKEAVG